MEDKQVVEDRKHLSMCCSFCGKRHDEVPSLIAGPGVYICSDCVEKCNQILSELPDDKG